MSKIASTTTVVDNYNGWTGEKLIKQVGASYVSGRDVKDIAKDVRDLIKKAVKAGLLPKSLKTSVKIERYSMGCTLNVIVTAIDECVLNIDAWRQQVASGYNLSWVDCGGMHNAKGREVLDLLTQFVRAFQKSEHHGQSDYDNTNFHDHIAFDSDVRNSQVSQFVEVENV